MFALSSRIQHMAANRDAVFSGGRLDIIGLLADRGGLSVRTTGALENIIDRVGIGGTLAAGTIHGIVSGMDRDATITFASVCLQWTHSAPGDFLWASVADIAALGAGGGDVR
jgi:2-dehydro-3-deoxygluconokinase